MRRILRLLVATAVATGVTFATAANPASAEGKCAWVGVDDTGTLVCTPDI